ncbi:lipoyl domain-containing protein [Capillimicrobium parvum]|uniref:Lipoyl-binding domain-containing protein n=1 Tax=Capillimicrobium parvum TaxID=2884022 RepID=A0A9E6XV73_9ACTN|nr:lipoyl domain-containing protein [Capillimicrobium parvum]UGS35075.1 hypothetical protein DSM104329_01459 [Capillimicrobium parvum]
MSAATISVRAPDGAFDDTDEGTEGLVDEWLVGEGDEVAADQEIASVMVVKTSFEIVAPVAGTVDRILVAKGATFGPEDDLVHIAPAA